MEIKLWEHEIPQYHAEYDTPNSMTAFPVPTWQKLPAIVIFSGGGYRVRTEHEGEEIARFYQSRGIHAFVVHYRLRPNKFPCALMDAQRAVKIIKKNADQYAVDENRIFVIGFSAGGHLAASLATTLRDYAKVGDEYDDITPDVAGAILGYPWLSDLDIDAPPGNHILTERLGESEEGFVLYNNVTEKTPPCFIWHTADDQVINVTQSLKFAQALKAHQVPFEMHIFPKGSHGLGLAKITKDISGWADLSIKWIQNNFM